MKILFITQGDRKKASSRVRAFWIGEELKHRGDHCNHAWPKTRWQVLANSRKLFFYDVIIFQKTYGRYHHWLQRIASLLGRKTFIDIDDAPSLNQNPKTLKRVAAMMRLADGVFVGSRNLKAYASEFNENTHLIPSTIKLENYPVKPETGGRGAEVGMSATAQRAKEEDRRAEVGEAKRICLGWIGNGSYYADDLISILVNPLKTLSQRYSIRLKIVGACGNHRLHEAFGAIEGLNYVGIDSIDWSNPKAVYEEIHSFDIGLYPLIENKFNRFKCGFKALEYMACGLPVVSSRVAINADIVLNGKSGYLADSDSEWTKALESLIQSAEERHRMGCKGRKTVEEDYSTAHAAELMKQAVLSASE